MKNKISNKDFNYQYLSSDVKAIIYDDEIRRSQRKRFTVEKRMEKLDSNIEETNPNRPEVCPG